MKNVQKINVLLILLLAFALLGCKSYLVPELGIIAKPEARIAFVDGKNIFSTKDVALEYTLVTGEETLSFTGQLRFDRSLTDSFSVAQSFFIRINYLDGQGRVMESIDITPLIPTRSQVIDPIRVSQRLPKMAGVENVAFNYFGVFRANTRDISENWSILYFPFE